MTQSAEYDSTTRFTRSNRAVSTEVGSETVLLHLDEGMYFGVDNVGNVIWDAMKDGASFDDLVGAVCEAFNVEATVAERDLVAFLQQLEAHKLVDVG